MEALFIENTSQTIKDYFNKNHESTIATSAQRSSLQGDSNESSKKRKRDGDTVPFNGKSTRRKQSDKQKDVTISSENTESKNENHSLIINGKNEKEYSSIEDSLPCRAFIIKTKCGKFKSLTISKWDLLECIIIGEKCCASCTMFYIADCPKLKSIIIGQSSFSSAKLDIQGDFFILLLYIDCHKLEEISFGEYSFEKSQSLSLHSMLPKLVSK